jgi:hypothetical protein
MALLVEVNPVAIPHEGCDGSFRPYADGEMACYCGAKLPVTLDDANLNIPISVLRDDC